MDSAPAEHPPHGNVTSYKKSLRLSSDQIVSDMPVLCIGCFITLKKFFKKKFKVYFCGKGRQLQGIFDNFFFCCV